MMRHIFSMIVLVAFLSPIAMADNTAYILMTNDRGWDTSQQNATIKANGDNGGIASHAANYNCSANSISFDYSVSATVHKFVNQNNNNEVNREFLMIATDVSDMDGFHVANGQTTTYYLAQDCLNANFPVGGFSNGQGTVGMAIENTNQ
jgi:hypothetical protein